MQEQIKKPEICLIKEWKSLSLSGVTNIIGFDESNIALDTDKGKIYVEGNELKINQLSEIGEILIHGNIRGVFVAENSIAKKGIFSKLFGK